jgi:RNA polymerase sigma-70 factor (ECF subfamily)
MSEASDLDLWAGATAGDAAAFGALFERHARTVYNYCFRRTGLWAEAEDLTSVVFLEAWRRRNEAADVQAVVPWLLGVATNVVRNRHRSRRRCAAALSRMPPPQPDPDHADEIAHRLDDESRMRQILQLVRHLPSIDQDVFILCAWTEMTYAQTAAALGVPVGTVRSRLSRARARLRELAARSGHQLDETVALARAPYARTKEERS